MHSHHHDHSHAPVENYNSIFGIGIILNLIYVIIEFIFGIRINSLALISDAGHNFSDVLSLVLAWLAAQLSKTKSFGQFTYGLKRSSILIAFINTVLLIIALGAIGWEAFERLTSEQGVPLTQGYNISIVAGIGIIINGITAYLFYKAGSEDINIKSAFWHMASDAIVSAGVVAGGIIIFYTNLYWIDNVLSLLIALIILYSTWGITKEAGRLILDAAPVSIPVHEVKRFLETFPSVSELRELHIWNISTTETALTVHLIVDRTVAVNSMVAQIKDELYHKFNIRKSTIQIMLQEGFDQKDAQ